MSPAEAAIDAAAEPLAKLLHPEAWFFGGRQDDRDAAVTRARGLLTAVVLPHILSALTEADAAATERAAKVADERAEHYGALLDEGKGTYGESGYVRDAPWASWVGRHAEAEHLASAIRNQP